jgi:hypothetical protein
MYKIKHLPTGLFYQPLRSGNCTLSYTGNIYPRKPNVSRCDVSFSGVTLPRVAKKVAEQYGLDPEELKGKTLKHDPSEWQVVRFEPSWIPVS